MSIFSRIWRRLHVSMAAEQRRRTNDAMSPAQIIAAAKAIEAGQRAARADRRLEEIAAAAKFKGVYVNGRFLGTFSLN